MPRGKPNKKYTSEYKCKVIERMRSEHLGYVETARLFDISGHERIRQWERIYLEEGPEGFEKERRGRKTGGGGRPPKLDKKVEADLIAENQRLRMENDYLKKLKALEEERTVPGSARQSKPSKR